MFLVADQIVIDEEDIPAPAETVQPIQFVEDLFGRLDAWPVSQQGGDVTELTIERTAARILDRHRGVAFEVDQLPKGRGRLTDVGKLAGQVHALSGTLLQVAQERRESYFRFVQDEMIDQFELLI